MKRHIAHMGKKNILVIDDDETILQVVQIILEDDYNVTTSITGKYIYNMDDRLPDLIILDVLLSGEDGREICRYLKSQQKTRDIPVILFSAHADTKKTASAAGADYFLPKPFDVDVLTDTVQKHLRHETPPAA